MSDEPKPSLKQLAELMDLVATVKSEPKKSLFRRVSEATLLTAVPTIVASVLVALILLVLNLINSEVKDAQAAISNSNMQSQQAIDGTREIAQANAIALKELSTVFPTMQNSIDGQREWMKSMQRKIDELYARDYTPAYSMDYNMEDSSGAYPAEESIQILEDEEEELVYRENIVQQMQVSRTLEELSNNLEQINK